ncbi:MAG: amidohydrolase [Lachnospiraceae bacterium]|nr:amidohydrolase [Lachnospiraceae bacterium]
MNICIEQALTLLPDGEGFRTEVTDLYVEGDTIAALGERPEGFAAERTIDGRGKLVIPGLINAHTHAYMTLMRNAADDVPFDEWLFRGVMPREDRMSPEDAYWGALLGLMEMVKCGTTCFNDMQMHIHQTTKAAVDLGIRGVIGRGLSGTSTDEGGARRLREAQEEIEAWRCEPLLSFLIAPHAPYSCEGAYMQQAADLAERLDLGLHIHLSESRNEVENARREWGMTPIEYVDSLGILRRPTVAAHCVWVTDHDIEILRERGVSVATNPASNMKLGNGFAPVPRMLQEGIRVCLGTDGAASNNGLNLFREMGLVTLIHKGVQQDAVSVSSAEALKMATKWGAEALGLGAVCGEIAVGKKADLAILDAQCPQLLPANNPVSALTYSVNGSEVETVIVDGKIILENRHFPGVDEERVYYEAAHRAENLCV